MRRKGHGKGSNKLGTLRFGIASYGSKPLNTWGEVGSGCDSKSRCWSIEVTSTGQGSYLPCLLAM